MCKPFGMHYLKGILELGAEKDYFTRHKQRYATVLSLIRALDVGEKLRVLDVGSGFGHLTILVKKIFDYEVYAVDCNSLREERLRKEGIKFNLCDLMTESLPFGGNYFDIVVFSEVIEHLFTPPLITLLDIHCVLKRQGLLILTTPNLYSLGNRILFLTGRRIIAPVTIGGNEGRVLKSIDDRGEFHSLIEACLRRQEKYGEAHFQLYGVDELRLLLNETGFKVIQARYLQTVVLFRG